MKNINKNMIKLHYGGMDHYFNEEDILNPGKHYEKLCNISSDINEHLPTLKKYASECKTVTEIDYAPFKPSDNLLNQMCNNYGIKFEFILGDTLKIQIENTDLLFIDTLHTYNQLIGELTLHSKNVNKWIILHDTTLFGDRDEYIYEHASDLIKNVEKNKIGINKAVDDFLSDNQNWIVKEVYTNCNGLTILERKF